MVKQIDNLLPNTIYYLKAYSKDKYDNEDSSKTYKVTTVR
jgi:hypothetical protein